MIRPWPNLPSRPRKAPNFSAYTQNTLRALNGLQPRCRWGLDRFIDEDAKVTVVVKRIKEILGIAGQPWNAWEQ
jgi:hypothetical protein